jgi:sarcosine oxidase subunit beta
MRVVVIGGGITGLSVGYNLAKNDAEVVVVESKYPGSGLSVRSIGGVHCQWDNEQDIKMAKKSREILSRLPDELDFLIPFRREGYLMIATNEENFGLLQKNAILQRELGVDTLTMTVEQISKRYKFLKTDTVVGGTFSKGDGVVHPFSVVFGYWHGLEDQGGKLYKSTTVTKLETDGDQVTAVLANDERFEADAFVLAAGSGTRELLRPLNHAVASRPIKYEMLATEPVRFFLKPMIQIWPNVLYVNQSIRGELVCSTPCPIGTGRDEGKSTLEFLEYAATELTNLLPSTRHLKVLRQWVGAIETTPRLKPFYGKIGYENLWVAYGDSGKGIVFAPAIGEMLSNSILSERTDPALLEYMRAS